MEMVNFAPVMFAGLIVIMLIGFPVAFSLAALGLASAFICYSNGLVSCSIHGQFAYFVVLHFEQ